MRICWKQDVELQVVELVDSADEPDSVVCEIFRLGEESEIDIQFGDGSVALNVERAWFDEISSDLTKDNEP